MKFSKTTPTYQERSLYELKNESDTVRLAILDYLCGQNRIQVWVGPERSILREM